MENKIEEFKKLVEYLKRIALLLEIDTPKLECDTNSKIVSSMYDPEIDTILLKEEPDDLEAYFAIAHEMRHKWQLITDYELYSAEKYGMQFAEIDSNAFAMIAMLKIIKKTHLFKTYPNNERMEIFARAQFLSSIYENDLNWDNVYKM